MNNSTFDISSHIRGFDIGSRFFFKKRPVFGVTLHAANTEHKKKIFLFVRNYRTGCKHLTPNQFLKKYLEAQQVWASKNIKKETKNV